MSISVHCRSRRDLEIRDLGNFFRVFLGNSTITVVRLLQNPLSIQMAVAAVAATIHGQYQPRPTVTATIHGQYQP